MKMLYRNSIIGVGLVAVLAGGSCKKALDINQNPNFPSLQQGTAQVVFPIGVLATTAYVGSNLEIVGGMWSQYFTQSAYANQYTDIDSYNMPSRDIFITATWDNLFTNGLKNYDFVIGHADSVQDWIYALMGTVMKAYTAEVLADMFDQIPYKEALQGTANLNPKFDDGFTVYKELLAELDSVKVKDFGAPTNSSPTSLQDPIFAGDANKWLAFLNTLELKMYLRMSKNQAAAAQAGINALYAHSPVFLSTDAAFTHFTDNPGLENPFYEQNIRQQNTNSNLRASTTLVSWLEANQDPRIVPFFGATSVLSVNQGDYHGSDPAYANAAIFVQSPLDPVEFISTAESYFLQAEADLRYFGGTKAQSLYEQGVTAAFSAVSLDASPYIGAGGVYAWGHEVEGGKVLTPIQQIIRQKWASCIYGCHGIEAFFEQNRIGFPLQSPVYSTSPAYIPGQLVIAKNSVLPAGSLPRRFVFPYDEVSTNTNVPATVPTNTPVWWAM